MARHRRHRPRAPYRRLLRRSEMPRIPPPGRHMRRRTYDVAAIAPPKRDPFGSDLQGEALELEWLRSGSFGALRPFDFHAAWPFLVRRSRPDPACGGRSTGGGYRPTTNRLRT